MSNEENKNSTSTQSTDMLAQEAIEHINNTPLKDLFGFVPEDEDRVTVLRAWEEKKEEKESEFTDFYYKLRKRIDQKRIKKSDKVNDRVLDGLLFLPDLFYLMVKMLFDRDVPTQNKGALLAGVLYVMSPVDLLPDFLPILGWVDDLVVTVFALNKYLDTRDPLIKQKIDYYWLNEKDFLNTFKHLLDVTDKAIEFLPRKMLSIVQGMFNTDFGSSGKSGDKNTGTDESE